MSKFLRTHRVFAALLAAVLAAAAVWLACRWVGYDLQQRLGNEPEYEIINDEYSQIVDLPEDGGLIQEIPLQAGQAFYGVRLCFSTHDQLYKSGMVMVDVYNAQGEQLLQSAGNFLNIFNDMFTEFTTERPYVAVRDETLTVHLYNAVPWDGPLGLWASEGEVDGMALYSGADGAQALDATLAVQRVSDYSGSWPADLAEQLAGPLAAAAFAATLLALLHAPLALLVAVTGLFLGTIFVHVTPALVAPDEYTHLAAAYELASVWNGQQPSQGGKLLVRSCDAPYFRTRTGEIGIFAYKEQETMRQKKPLCVNVLTEVSEADAGQGSGNYWAQAAGIWLARAQHWNFYKMLDFGRAANLLLYLALAAAAVASAPAALRGLFAAVALLPMPLQLAASLSPDAAVLGTVFLFAALCLSLRAQPGRRWQLALLVLLGAAVAPAKAIYLPVVLLCLAIPPEHLDPRRAPAQASVSLHGVSVRPGRLVQAAVLALAAVLWVVSNASALAYAARDMSTPMLAAAALAALAALAVLCALYLRVRADAAKRRRFWRGVAVAAVLAVAGGLFAFSRMGGGLTPDQLLEVQPNGDSVWTFSFGYICRNLPATLKLLLRTLPEQGALWLQGLLGTTLGEPIVYRIDVSWLLGVGLVLALLAAALPTAESAPLGRRMAWCTVGILACVALAVLAAALNWTPINYQTLFGMQGRYLLPVLPLALLLLRAQHLVALRRSAAHGAALAVALLTLLTQLQGFALYAAWQPVS